MKIHFLLFVWYSLTVSNLYAQVRIGYTEQDIRNEFPERTFEAQKTHNGTPYISTEVANWGFVAYYFDENGICFRCLFVPENQGFINTVVEQYNREYVIVSDTRWKMYYSNGIIYIQLIFKKYNAYFLYTNYGYE